MESAYTLAFAELSKRRERNRAEHERRLGEVRIAKPEFERIEKTLAAKGTALVRLIMERSADFSDIESDIKQLQHQKIEILRSLNLPNDYLDDIYSCDKCRDTGFDENGNRCSCLKQLTARFMGQNSNLTERMKAQTFGNFDFSLFSGQPPEGGRDPLNRIKRIHGICKDFADSFETTHENLLMMGNAGTGKTYLSSCIANRALERGKTVYYQTAFKLFDMLEKLKFNRCGADEQEQFKAVYDYVFSVDLLIIDDLGTEFVSGYSTVALFNIVNSRCLDGKSTILSTNLNTESMTGLYSQRFTSRLFGEFLTLTFIGRDLRMMKLK